MRPVRGERRPLVWLFLLALTIALGLASRRFGDHLPSFVAAYAGDTLWATVAFLMFGLILRRASTGTVALLAISFSVLVELSQLYKAPWIEALRRTTLGGLLLGFDFVWSDLICYTVGVGLGLLIQSGTQRAGSMSCDRQGRSLWQAVKRPPWRTVVPAAALLLAGLIAYLIWSPGRDVTDGRHDRGRNGIWLQHGWLGHDSWFSENGKTDRISHFRSAQTIRELAKTLRRHHVTDVFPHLCPTTTTGEVMPVDAGQTERFLDELTGFRVLPWVGGVMDGDVTPDIPRRRKLFVQSIATLLRRHPRLSGVHLNVEPWPSGHRSMLTLLDDIRAALPPGKILSVAAYPPPTHWHPFPEVHWEEAYFKEVAKRVDQMAVMMYDTSIRHGKLYQHVMRSWTRQVLDWTSTPGVERPPAILLGVPTYDDAGSGYHDPKVENTANALLGIHGGLNDYPSLPPHYQGAAVYCEWETSESEWRYWQEHWLRDRASGGLP